MYVDLTKALLHDLNIHSISLFCVSLYILQNTAAKWPKKPEITA